MILSLGKVEEQRIRSTGGPEAEADVKLAQAKTQAAIDLLEDAAARRSIADLKQVLEAAKKAQPGLESAVAKAESESLQSTNLLDRKKAERDKLRLPDADLEKRIEGLLGAANNAQDLYKSIQTDPNQTPADRAIFAERAKAAQQTYEDAEREKQLRGRRLKQLESEVPKLENQDALLQQSLADARATAIKNKNRITELPGEIAQNTTVESIKSGSRGVDQLPDLIEKAYSADAAFLSGHKLDKGQTEAITALKTMLDKGHQNTQQILELILTSAKKTGIAGARHPGDSGTNCQNRSCGPASRLCRRPSLNPNPTYTAAMIAAALEIKRQAVQWHLREVSPAGVLIVAGNEASAWTVAQLSKPLRQRLEAEAVRQNCRTIDALLSMPRQQWQPAIPLDKISDDVIQVATKLRDALKPWLIQQHVPNLSAAELEDRGIADYQRFFGNRITARYWRELFMRTIRRDNGAEAWNRLEIYLPDRLKEKAAPAAIVSEALAADFADLENFIAACPNPHVLNKAECVGLWALALGKYAELMRAGQSEKAAGRRVRQFLFARAKFLAPTRNALRMAWERKLDQWQRDNPASLADGRSANGDRPEYPAQDIRCVRHSAVTKNGKRIDTAWREEYPRLSEYTRQRHPGRPRKCPRAFYQLVNRQKVDALKARLDGKRTLRRMVGGVTRSAEGIHTMARWAVDDLTANIECYVRNPDGTVSLIQPQVIAVMDFASCKFVGWSVANVKAPNTKLVNAAILDGFKRHNVPHRLWVENGFVFGKSLDINGKEDEQGRTIVAGLAQYGCKINHFDKMSPTSKGELEKSFDLLQRQMERHPGYTGRMQMLDASEDFKREQRLIRSGKVPASDSRYSYDEFIRVLHGLFEAFNAEPQHGHLRGLSPNEAFEILQDPANPPVAYDNRLHWYFSNTRDLVRVEPGGVKLPRRKIQVRGGELPQHIGEELWALVDREDDSMVTFMSQDYRHTFTVETCRQPSADASSIATGSTVLAAELAKIGNHMRAVDGDLKDLKAEFGDPRKDMLARIRGESAALANVPDGTTRKLNLNPRLEAVGPNIAAQRQAITTKRRQNTVDRKKAGRLGIPAAMVRDDARFRRAIELV